jgi:hypothetical protein
MASKSDKGIAGELKILTLDIRTRLNLEGLIRQERPEDTDTVYTLRDIMSKIRIPEEERKKYVNQTRQGLAFDDKAIIESKDTISVELNMPEARTLKSVVKKWRPNVDDLFWWDPLLEQLENVK